MSGVPKAHRVAGRPARNSERLPGGPRPAGDALTPRQLKVQLGRLLTRYWNLSVDGANELRWHGPGPTVAGYTRQAVQVQKEIRALIDRLGRR